MKKLVTLATLLMVSGGLMAAPTHFESKPREPQKHQVAPKPKKEFRAERQQAKKPAPKKQRQTRMEEPRRQEQKRLNEQHRPVQTQGNHAPAQKPMPQNDRPQAHR